MKQIAIGTCIPGIKALEWTTPLTDAGFECIAVNFHMTLSGIRLEELAPKVNALLEGKDAYVSSVGFYCNPLQYPDHAETLKYGIDNAHLFHTDMVTTFAGALEGKPVEESIPVFKKVFSELTRYAADKGVKIALENCPMEGSWNSPTCNIAFNPRAWEMMFNEVDADNLGLEWEPAHQMIQLIDPIAQLRKWAPKILHLHGKDASVDRTAVSEYGVFGAVEFAPERMPGFGDCNWRDIFSILHEKGYEGDLCVEGYHDPVYRGDWEMTAQLHALRYLTWCRGGDFTPNPWDK